jgi:Rrf2 family transcriptional regulator, cysteine metabolism repressor
MQISYKCDYALKAILDLSEHYDKGVVTIHEVAKRIDAPVKFLEQVLLELKRGGFVESRRGINGGYALARPPEKIPIGEVVRFIEGPINPIACVAKDYAGCPHKKGCVFLPLWNAVEKATSEIIDRTTFEDLVKQLDSHQETIAYSI